MKSLARLRPRPLPTHPLAHGGPPAHDAALQPGVRAHPRALHHRAALDPHAVLHDHAGADGDVRADGAVLPDLRRRVLRGEGGGGGVTIGGGGALIGHAGGGRQTDSPPGRCPGNRAPRAASRERVAAATGGTCTSPSGSLWADRCPSRSLKTNKQMKRRINKNRQTKTNKWRDRRGDEFNVYAYTLHVNILYM